MVVNLNDTVKIKLTALGLKKLEADHYEYTTHPFTMPITDTNGYMSMTLWEVMQIFGKSMCNGCPLVIETDIILPINS